MGLMAPKTMPPQDTEPRPLAGRPPFDDWDFEGLAPSKASKADFNDRRLAARRKLAGLGKDLVAAGKEEGLGLLSRTSIHNPHAFNGNRVKRLWAYVTRDKKAKSGLRKVLGRDLAKDLDSAYRNAYLCVALEHEAIEVSLRIHPDAWYDGQNLVKRLKAEGVQAWRGLLNQLEGFQLRMHDWKGEWRCGELTPEQLEEYLRFYTPGEHALAVERRWPVPAGPAMRAAREPVLAEGVPAMLVEEAARLLPLYRFTAWSDESSFLFSG